MASGPQDNPDWIGLAQAVANVIYPPTQTPLATAAAVQLGTFYVGNVAGLFVDLSTLGIAQLVQLSLSFGNDSNGANTFHTYALTADLVQETITYIPVYGNFVTVTLAPQGGGNAALIAGVSIVGIAEGFRATQFVGREAGLNNATAGVAPGALITVKANLTTPGDWQLSALSTQPNLVAVVEQQFTNGVWLGVAQFESATLASVGGRAALVAAPTRVRAVNRAAVAADLVISLLPVG